MKISERISALLDEATTFVVSAGDAEEQGDFGLTGRAARQAGQAAPTSSGASGVPRKTQACPPGTVRSNSAGACVALRGAKRF